MNLTDSLATQFVVAARGILRHGDDPEAFQEYAEQQRSAGRVQSLAKALVAANDTTQGWFGSDGRAIVDSYLSSIKPRSLLDSVMQYATPIPPNLNRLVVATGIAAAEVDEGAGKAVTRAIPTIRDSDFYKVAGIVILSDELAMSDSGQANRIFARELMNAVIRAGNTSLLSRLTTTTVATTGTVAGDIEAGLAAAADSEGFVIAVPQAKVRALALGAQGRMGVNGGEYLPGLHVVPYSGTSVIVIPASQLAIADGGLVVRSARHASVEMDTSPTGGHAQLVNLWQANLMGILCERWTEIASNANAIEVA